MIKFEDFILEYDDFFSQEECFKYIKYYNHLEQCGFTFPRSDQSHKRQDKSFAFQEIVDYNITGQEYDLLNAGQNYAKYFLDKFWDIPYKIYSEKYSILNEMSPHQVLALKIQKNKPTEAYHIWHNECSNRANFKRFLTFILYLNDIEDGGETEFLYYPKRVKPKMGKLILFPGFFTHSHRGNQPLSGEKYIITGWVHFNE